jgi:hypothetical protein
MAFEARAAAPFRGMPVLAAHRGLANLQACCFEKPRRLKAPEIFLIILASVEFGIISSLAMRPAWLQMRATMK